MERERYNLRETCTVPEFRPVSGLNTLVNDNHVDNDLKESLAFVYYGSIVNNRPKDEKLDWLAGDVPKMLVEW